MLKRVLLVLSLLTFAGSSFSRADAALLTLADGGNVEGVPGETVGWGFTIDNPDPTAFIVVTQWMLDPDPSALGTFTSYAFNYFVVGAGPYASGSIYSEAFDPTAQTGVGEFTISALAAPGTSFASQVVMLYDLYSRSPNDPSFDPEIHLVATGQTLQAAATITVVPEAPPTSVPEPSTILMSVVGLGAVLWTRRAGPVLRTRRVQESAAGSKEQDPAYES